MTCANIVWGVFRLVQWTTTLPAFAGLDDWKAIQPEATRVAISPLFPLLPLQKSFAEISRPEDLSKIHDCSFVENACAECGGPGQPKLLVCGRCKKLQYCSQKCQKAHWKQHKANCVAMKKCVHSNKPV